MAVFPTGLPMLLGAEGLLTAFFLRVFVHEALLQACGTVLKLILHDMVTLIHQILIQFHLENKELDSIFCFLEASIPIFSKPSAFWKNCVNGSFPHEVAKQATRQPGFDKRIN